MDISLLQRMFEYKAWSERRLLAVVEQVDNDSDLMAFCRQQLNHMLIVQELFCARLFGDKDPHQETNTGSLPQLSELRSRLASSNFKLNTFIGNLDLTVEKEPVNFTFVDGLKGRMSVLEILVHLTTHGTYHRSAIGHRLEQEGYTRPADTFSMFVHQSEPIRRESS